MKRHWLDKEENFFCLHRSGEGNQGMGGAIDIPAASRCPKEDFPLKDKKKDFALVPQ